MLVRRPPSLLNGVPTRHCEQGHPNDPDEHNCVMCRIALDLSSPVEDAEPRPFARITVHDGPTVDLEAEIIIGRSPIGEAHHLALEDPQVSRSHLLISTRGWRVMIRDLGSANGTYLHRLNARSRRIVPKDRFVPIAVGDQLYFGRSRASILASKT